MMTKKFRLIPFEMMPGSWGLSGSTRQIAQAEYYYDGYDLEVEICKIKYPDEKEQKLKLLALANDHKKISAYEHDLEVAKVSNPDEDKFNLAKLDVDLLHDKISKTDYDRLKADLLSEPWVSIPKINWDPTFSSSTYFELDYNQHFLRYLMEHDYQGTEDEIINQWVNDVARSVIAEDTFNSQAQNFVVSKMRRDDGLVEHM
jgi:hypothetical protein